MGRGVNRRYLNYNNSASGEAFYNDRIGIARYKRKGLSTVGSAASARIKDQLSKTVFTIEMTAGANPWTEVMELVDDFVTTTTDTDDIGKFNIEARTGALGVARIVTKLEQHQATVRVRAGVYETITWPKTRREAGINPVTSWSMVSQVLSVTVPVISIYAVGNWIRFLGTGNSDLRDTNIFQISSIDTATSTFVINVGSPYSDDASTNTGRSPGTAIKTGVDHIDLRE